MIDYNNYDNATKRQEIAGGDTAITRQCSFVNNLSYDRLTANKMLDSVKDGQSYPPTILALCLQATGDMP